MQIENTMAYNEALEERISEILKDKHVHFFKKKMFGGLTFMINDKMCVGIVKEQLMARVGPSKMEEALEKEAAKPMDFTGRPMKGYVFVGPEGIDLDNDLEYFIDLSLDFNKEITA